MSSSFHILVVDDTPMNLELCCAFLERGGHHTSTAATGAAALESIRNGGIDLVLMDVHLPDINGVETTRKIRKDLALSAESLPVIALTAHATQAEIREFFECGMNDCLLKPLNAERLLQAIHDTMDPNAVTPLPPGSARLLNTKRTQDFFAMTGTAKAHDAVLNFYDAAEEMMAHAMTANADRAALYDRIHRVAGTAGHLGLEQMSQSCRAILDKIKTMPDDDLRAAIRHIHRLYRNGKDALSDFMTQR